MVLAFGESVKGRILGTIVVSTWRGVGRASLERLLADWAELSSDAVACAINAGHLEQTVELLEHDCGVMWSQLLHSRTGVALLREANPTLCSRLDEVRNTLEQLGTTISEE